MLLTNTIGSVAELFGAGIILGLLIVGISIFISIMIIKFIIDYAAKKIGREVAGKFNYDYLAKMIAYEIKNKDQ